MMRSSPYDAVNDYETPPRDDDDGPDAVALHDEIATAQGLVGLREMMATDFARRRSTLNRDVYGKIAEYLVPKTEPGDANEWSRYCAWCDGDE